MNTGTKGRGVPKRGKIMVVSSLRICALLLSLFIGLSTVPAQASLLNLELRPAPDLYVSLVDVEYDAVGDLFEVSGFNTQLLYPWDTTQSVLPDASLGNIFTLQAKILADGVLQPGGSFTATGSVVIEGMTRSGVLLTGDLYDFGFGTKDGAVTFEFLYDVSGGLLQNIFINEFLDPGGIIINGVNPKIDPLDDASERIFKDFKEDYMLASLNADVGIIPLPGVLLFLVSGLIFLQSGRFLQHRTPA